MLDTNSFKKAFLSELDKAESTSELQQVRIKYFGKKGLLTAQLKNLSTMPAEEKRSFGKAVNELKGFFENEIALKESTLGNADLKKRLSSETIDVTLPGKYTPAGREHPINKVLREIEDIFVSMGFGVEEGPQVELDYYNFEALNMPKDHPARDMQDTFYITDDVMLRTHTSPVQIRTMEKKKPPLRFIAPGKVYRCDADISHTPMFHQVE
ncbi:MAG TPA: phenylalanine--tRNA ligase subunit alpha, partial [Deltaproteobacteria bacterium]|nr:phenylalanine--tRNA ligase subunit alpha [Deltaproteobacteria bacterium]